MKDILWNINDLSLLVERQREFGWIKIINKNNSNRKFLKKNFINCL